MHTVAFPGLGLEFEINSVAFSIAGIEVKWYGILITIGICLALFMFYRYASKKEGLPEDHLYNLALITVPVSIVGARVMYVVTEWDRYRGDFLKMINIREGGLAIYGAIIFGIITVYTYSRITKLSTLKLMDAAAPAVMIGQAIGRWGNFMNAEAYGYSPGVETLPWRMEITDSLGRVTVAHPTFLYESLWNFVGILLIYLIFYKKKKFDGQILFTYLGWYGFGRMWIEMLRTDSLYLFKGWLGETIKISVFIGAVSVVASIVGMTILYRKAKKKAAQEAYTPKFASVKVETVEESEIPQEEEAPAEASEETPEE
ncbi:MAG: prolipoprotein diacylglyceryl transferase [Clostridia bacterium]|nr:prolipoprotein diacylglyceryl transferase [Clostridia bacterium]